MSSTILDEIAKEELIIAETNNKTSHCCAYDGSMGCLEMIFSFQTARDMEHILYDIFPAVREFREEIKLK